MTLAPGNLLAVRKLLLAELGPHGLASAEVGIVGDSAHRGGYHCGRDRVVAGDYSVVESPRDRNGLTDHAAGLDVGTFSVRSGGRTHNLMSFSTWCVGQCKANAPDTRDIREIIYSPDGRVVRRYDALGRRSSGDDSHLYHTHFSFFRDAIKAGRDQTPLFRRYLTTIGLIEGDDDMSEKAEQQIAELHAIITGWRSGMPKTPDGRGIEPVAWRIRDESWQAKVSAALSGLAGRDWTDEPAIVQGVLAGLTPEAIAAAIPTTLARQVADELARRMSADTTPQS